MWFCGQCAWGGLQLRPGVLRRGLQVLPAGIFFILKYSYRYSSYTEVLLQIQFFYWSTPASSRYISYTEVLLLPAGIVLFTEVLLLPAGTVLYTEVLLLLQQVHFFILKYSCVQQVHFLYWSTPGSLIIWHLQPDQINMAVLFWSLIVIVR